MAKQRLCGDQWISLMQNEAGTLSVKMDDGVTIVPLTEDNKVLMITEPSVAYDGLRSLLLPSGELEEGESHAECANRELQEEIGFKAERLDSLGTVYKSIKYMESKIHYFLARDLQPSQLTGDEEAGSIELAEPIALEDIEKMIAEGRLLDAATIAALMLARSYLEKSG